MVAFIEQEASEKAEEIDAKAEEEFNIEKESMNTRIHAVYSIWDSVTSELVMSQKISPKFE